MRWGDYQNDLYRYEQYKAWTWNSLDAFYDYVLASIEELMSDDLIFYQVYERDTGTLELTGIYYESAREEMSQVLKAFGAEEPLPGRRRIYRSWKGTYDRETNT